MKTFTEWLQEATTVAKDKKQCVQGDRPSVGGACTGAIANAGIDGVPMPERGRKLKKAKLKKEAIVVGPQPPGVGVQGGKSDFVIAGAPKRRKKRRKKA
jgi:hypothetical protein